MASAHEAQYAAGAVLSAERSPNPPKRMGRAAMRSAMFCCVASPGSLPKMVLIAFRIPASWPAEYSADWLGGMVLRRW